FLLRAALYAWNGKRGQHKQPTSQVSFHLRLLSVNSVFLDQAEGAGAPRPDTNSIGLPRVRNPPLGPHQATSAALQYCRFKASAISSRDSSSQRRPRQKCRQL